MRVRRLSGRPVVLLLLLASMTAVASTTASAQARRLFIWSGRVDREVRLTMRGEDVDSRNVGDRYDRDDRDDRAGRSRVTAPLPHAPGRVSVELLDGRGDVDIIQQPNADNDYSAVFRIRDARAGSDQYRLAAYWQPVDDRVDRWRGRHGAGSDADNDDRDRDDHRGDRDRGGSYGRYGEGGMHWSGNVDDALEIRIQGRRVDYRRLSGAGMRGVRYGFTGVPLPDRDAQVYVSTNQGRGSVSVVEQPSPRNDYTAVIRVRDPQGGFGHYDFDVRWR